MCANQLNASFDVGFSTCTVDERCVVFANRSALYASKVFKSHVLELVSQVLGDGFATGESSDVREHLFATIAKAWSLNSTDFDGSTKLVNNECCKRFTVDIFCNDEKRATGFGNRFKCWKEVLHVRDLLLVDENKSIVHDRFHALLVSHEVRAQVAAVELHAFNNVELRLKSLGFFDRNDTFFANLLHGVCDHLADVGVAVC